jgi:hypothetical protein
MPDHPRITASIRINRCCVRKREILDAVCTNELIEGLVGDHCGKALFHWCWVTIRRFSSGFARYRKSRGSRITHSNIHSWKNSVLPVLPRRDKKSSSKSVNASPLLDLMVKHKSASDVVGLQGEFYPHQVPLQVHCRRLDDQVGGLLRLDTWEFFVLIGDIQL